MISKETVQCVKFYEEGLKLYREKKFNDALKKFEEALSYKPDDNPSKIFIDRCKYFMKNPVPEHWDGVFDMKTK